MNIKRKILFLAFALFGLFLFPLRTAAQSSTIRFGRLTVEDGLSQNAVLTIAQDGRGFLWLGTEDGLNKYDGYKFTVYEHDPEDPASLVDGFVSVTYVDHQGISGWVRAAVSIGTIRRRGHSSISPTMLPIPITFKVSGSSAYLKIATESYGSGPKKGD